MKYLILKIIKPTLNSVIIFLGGTRVLVELKARRGRKNKAGDYMLASKVFLKNTKAKDKNQQN